MMLLEMNTALATALNLSSRATACLPSEYFPAFLAAPYLNTQAAATSPCASVKAGDLRVPVLHDDEY